MIVKKKIFSPRYFPPVKNRSINSEPFGIALSNALQHQELLRLKNVLADENRHLHFEIKSQVGDETVGANFGLKGVMEMVRQVAPLSLGKEISPPCRIYL